MGTTLRFDADDGMTQGIHHGVSHYENFPVASILCPPHLRKAVAAIYWFARSADDLADEGDATAQQRLDDLAAYAADLNAIYNGQAPSPRWAGIFEALRNAAKSHHLPQALLADLLSAFEQDVRHTANGHRYASRAELFDYCRRSANPVGRLLLHLYGVTAAEALEASDQVCTALQLINFWQDLSVDIPRGRWYLPLDASAQFGLGHDQMLALPAAAMVSQNAIELVASEVAISRTEMQKGQKIVAFVPGRAAWELRLVVQGGLAIARRIQGMGHNTWQHRPALRKRDAPGVLWRALWM